MNNNNGDEGEPEYADEAPVTDNRQVAELIQAAEREAENILENAREEAQEFIQQAVNDGYLEGFNKGYEEALSEFKRVNDPLAEKLADLVESLSGFEENRLKQNEQELVELALGIAARVIGRELSAKPETIVSMLSESVTQNHSEEYIRITLAEDLLPIDVKASAEIKSMLEGLGANVTVIPDPRVPAGTIQMETPKGIIDMSVDTQLENIRSIIKGD